MNDLFEVGDANLSSDLKHRFTLTRVWSKNDGIVAFIGLNPSTADSNEDDPTIRRCKRFARDWGYGGIVMLNLFSSRHTDPKELKTCSEPNISVSDYYLFDWVKEASLVVAAWGVHGSFRERDSQVKRHLKYLAEQVYCLGKTKDGLPRHPLYVPASKQLEPYDL